jgi:uncharacterized protein
MTWMLTATGSVVNLLTMEKDSISLSDIAHHLAQTNRYTGACIRPYSVAEHSLFVCELMEEAGVRDPSALLAGLMHDAHEAYTQDLSSPMKELIGAAWAKEERRIQIAVLDRFGLVGATQVWHAEIKHADLVALSTERAQLLPPTGPAWPTTTSHPPVTWRHFDRSAIFTWRDWRDIFADKFGELNFARKTRARLGLGALA